jgi:hypothetical protein
MLALTLFKLAPRRTIEQYRAYSLTSLRERMLALPSVLGFLDLEVTGSMDGAPARWELIEVIEIADSAAFEADHRSDPGKTIAEEWGEWVSDHCVLYARDLAFEPVREKQATPLSERA